MNFAFPSEVYVAITDSAHPYRDRGGDITALGKETDGSDDSAVALLQNKGVLVQVGMTGY